jgi:hypothetical protein
MSKIQTILDTLMNDSSVKKFSLKVKKDGLVFIKTKDQHRETEYRVESETIEGHDLITKARTSVGKGRWEMVHQLREQGRYTTLEIALIFDITQKAVKFMLASTEFDINEQYA